MRSPQNLWIQRVIVRIENMGAAAAQRREYGWLLVAERLPFFSVSDLLLWGSNKISDMLQVTILFFLESKQFFSFFGDAEDLFATAPCQDILMALAVRCMKRRERERVGGWGCNLVWLLIVQDYFYSWKMMNCFLQLFAPNLLNWVFFAGTPLLHLEIISYLHVLSMDSRS